MREGEGGRERHPNTYPENDIETEDEIFDATTDFRPLVVLPGHPLRSSRRSLAARVRSKAGKNEGKKKRGGGL